MLWLQPHYILVLYWIIIKCCTSNTNTNTTIYISSTNIIPPSTSNIYTTITTSPQSKSFWDNILEHQIDGLNAIFLIICGLLILCTFCCVFYYFICQHSRRKGKLKKQIAANTEKKKRSAAVNLNNINNIHEGNDNKKDIHITMDKGTSNTITSSLDNNHISQPKNNPQKHQTNILYNDNNFGLGSPKNHLHQHQTNLPNQIEAISPIQRHSHSHLSSTNKAPSPKQTVPPPNNNNNNGRYSRRTTHKSHSTNKSPHNKEKKNKQTKNTTKHVQIPSNLAAEMEMASFIPMGMDINNKSDDNSASLSSSDIEDDDENIGLTEHEHKKQHKNDENPTTATYANNFNANKKMRSFSRRTASLDNFNKKIAYDDMAKDPELAQYAQHGQHHHDQESQDTDSTSESSDESTDDEDDDSEDDTSSDSEEGTEGTSNDSSSSEDESDDESEDGGHHDTTTGDFMQNFGNNNVHLYSKQHVHVQQHLAVNKVNKSPKSKSKSKSKKKSPRKSPKNLKHVQEKYHGSHNIILHEEDDGDSKKIEEDEVGDINIVNPIQVIKGKRLKKHHVADNSDAFGSFGDIVQVEHALKHEINDVVKHGDEYFED